VGGLNSFLINTIKLNKMVYSEKIKVELSVEDIDPKEMNNLTVMRILVTIRTLIRLKARF